MGNMSAKPTFDHELFAAEAKKAFGDEALAKLDGAPAYGAPGTFVPTSSDTLNMALGIGGLPRGRVVEIYGPESGGKSSLALDICAQAQKMFPGGTVFYGDAENALNVPYARAIGVDLSCKRFIVAQTAETEQMLDLAYKAAKHGAVVTVVDSVAALSLKSDMEDDETTESRVGGNAKAIRAHLRRMVPVIGQTNCIAIYINHITYKVGVVYGNPETTTGGKGLPFFASVRMDVRSSPSDRLVDKETGEIYGIKSKVKIVKNKVPPPSLVRSWHCGSTTSGSHLVYFYH